MSVLSSQRTFFWAPKAWTLSGNMPALTLVGVGPVPVSSLRGTISGRDPGGTAQAGLLLEAAGTIKTGMLFCPGYGKRNVRSQEQGLPSE